jgi:hypothetical protein
MGINSTVRHVLSTITIIWLLVSIQQTSLAQSRAELGEDEVTTVVATENVVAGEILTIQVLPLYGDFNPLIGIQRDNRFVARSTPVDENIAIELIHTFVEGGRYDIVIGTINGEMGEFIYSIQSSDDTGDALPYESETATVLTQSQLVRGTLTNIDLSDIYYMYIDNGQSLTVDVVALTDNIAPLLTLSYLETAGMQPQRGETVQLTNGRRGQWFVLAVVNRQASDDEYTGQYELTFELQD